MMMWMDRELEEHKVYDHFSTLNPSTGTMQYHNNGIGPPNGGNNAIYAHLQQQPQHSSTPTTTNSMGMESSLGGESSPPPMSMDLDNDNGPLHGHSTLPAVDHRLPMDNHHIDDNGQDIYGHLYHQPHHLLSSAGLDQPQHVMLSSSSSCLGPCLGDQETAMMMQSPNGDSDLMGSSVDGHAHIHHLVHEEGKMMKTPKERKNYLQIYARQFGLNDRGCYVAVGLAALAFLLFVIVIAMGATWPGMSLGCFLDFRERV